MKELGEIDMVTLGPVAEDDARPAFPAVHLKGLAALRPGHADRQSGPLVAIQG